MMRTIPPGERGAALIAVLVMVALLAALATLGLSRLRATTDRVSDAEALSRVNLLAEAGVRTSLGLAMRVKARGRRGAAIMAEPVRLPLPGGTVIMRFSDGGACFNLNSLAPSDRDGRADARAADLARLLTALGVSLSDADPVAEATVARLAGTGILWADPSEWVLVPGVTPAIWQLARPLLCTLPTREASSFNVNTLTAAQMPLLVALGLSPDEARRAVAARPADGWENADSFWAAVSTEGTPGSAGAAATGTSSRWIEVRVLAVSADATAERLILIDTIRTPARIASVVWLPPPSRAMVAPLLEDMA